MINVLIHDQEHNHERNMNIYVYREFVYWHSRFLREEGLPLPRVVGLLPVGPKEVFCFPQPPNGNTDGGILQSTSRRSVYFAIGPCSCGFGI
ncbi:hypothetical protein CEXT_21811 [Caerostris extrusa]|uniref:Uncharacterized protein n=1 Tax=Caerostris extrusa TaxID=172846 RepID=A0AAV4MH92_CAEEX|nr:hypothetical protein CEXT_21811 [Caerostris extrusa]